RIEIEQGLDVAAHGERPTSLTFQLSFGLRLEAGKTLLEAAADHFVSAEKETHQLRDEGRFAGHRPGHGGAVGFGLEREFGGVVALERLQEIELEYDFARRRRVDDFHPAGAELLALPSIGRT